MFDRGWSYPAEKDKPNGLPPVFGSGAFSTPAPHYTFRRAPKRIPGRDRMKDLAGMNYNETFKDAEEGP
uniref:Uncharacterized protein n=1 Tax=Steinernema glaseri TaxID=37863 RepID=A0A1I8ATJ3_9BILA